MLMCSSYTPGGNCASEEIDLFMDDGEDEVMEFSTIEHLLYGYYYEDIDDIIFNKENKTYYSTEELLELWRKYVELDEKNQVVWELNFQLCQWEDIKDIMKNLEAVKAADKELFAKLFTGNLVSCLLYEIVRDENLNLTKKEQEALFKWIRKHKEQEFEQKDFWRVLKYHTKQKNSMANYYDVDKISVEYSHWWRQCCQKPIYLSTQDPMQWNTFEHCADSYGVLSAFYFIRMLLQMCDGMVGKYKYVKDDYLLQMIQENDKELLYECLQKNFVSKEMVKNRMDDVLENQCYDMIPLLLLKCHGEWPERDAEE